MISRKAPLKVFASSLCDNYIFCAFPPNLMESFPATAIEQCPKYQALNENKILKIL